MRINHRLYRWLSIVLGLTAGGWKAAEAKPIKRQNVPAGKEQQRPHLAESDAVGVFCLKYVDCQPYGGPEQVISIDKKGNIECLRQGEAEGPWRHRESNPTNKRKGVGRLRSGTLLKGELDFSPGFRSIAHGANEEIKKARLQVVAMPGGSGIWLALESGKSGKSRSWDEIYVRFSESSQLDPRTGLAGQGDLA